MTSSEGGAALAGVDAVQLPAPSAERRMGAWLYLITDGGGGLPPAELAARLTAALGAVPPGAVAVQLRDRALGGAALWRCAEQLHALTRSLGALLFINDRLDVALAVGADGVHLPAHGLPARAARRAGGAALFIGASTHSLAEARMAVAGGADFVTFGPIWPTPSKPAGAALSAGAARLSPLGPQALAAVVAALPVPVFALGGVDSVERAQRCAQAGARLACLRAVLQAPDVAAAAQRLLAAAQRPASCTW